MPRHVAEWAMHRADVLANTLQRNLNSESAGSRLGACGALKYSDTISWGKVVGIAHAHRAKAEEVV